MHASFRVAVGRCNVGRISFNLAPKLVQWGSSLVGRGTNTALQDHFHFQLKASKPFLPGIGWRAPFDRFDRLTGSSNGFKRSQTF